MYDFYFVEDSDDDDLAARAERIHSFKSSLDVLCAAVGYRIKPETILRQAKELGLLVEDEDDKTDEE